LELVRRRPLVVFFLLAFALTWAVWIPRAMGVDFGIIGRLWTWMAAAAAVLAAALTGGRTAVRQLFRRLLRWRVGWQWYVVVILGPAAFSAAIAAVYVLLGGSWSAAAPDAFTTSLPMLGLFLLALTFTDGLGEEPAWRGFALPRLLSRFNALIASLVLGVLWGAWHLPLIWTAGSALQSQPVWLLLLDISAKSVLFTWVFLRTRGSALVAVLLHGTTNLFEVSPVVGSTGELAYPMLAAAGKWVLVAILVAWAGPRLTRRPSPEALAQPAEQAY
jgi:membrane protease YdiL (CAAX protease family)